MYMLLSILISFRVIWLFDNVLFFLATIIKGFFLLFFCLFNISFLVCSIFLHLELQDCLFP